MPLAFLIGEGVSSAIDAIADRGPVELQLHLKQYPDGETRFAVSSNMAADRAGATNPSARLIDAFARQLGAAVGRDAESPFILWVCVPPHEAAAE